MADIDPYQKLLNAAFRFVSYRPRSEKEIRDFLQKKLKRYKIKDNAVFEQVIERVRELGYIDDKKFVSWWLEQRATHRPKGNRLLLQELKAKGIDQKLISDELGNARRAIQKKIILWKRLLPLARKKKIYDFLARRGFAGSTIFRIIDEAVGKEYNDVEDLNEENRE